MIEPYSPDKPLPSADVVRRWNRVELLVYLDPLFDKEDKDAFSKAKVSGNAFLRLDLKKIEKIGLPLGPTEDLLDLIQRINGGRLPRFMKVVCMLNNVDTSDSPASKRLKSASDGVNCAI